MSLREQMKIRRGKGWHRFVKDSKWTDAHRFFAFWVLKKRGIPFKTEYHITTESGWTFKVDTLAYHDVIIEHWGESHLEDRQQEKDAWRKGLLEDDGWTVLPFWDWEIWDDPEGCADKVEATQCPTAP